VADDTVPELKAGRANLGQKLMESQTGSTDNGRVSMLLVRLGDFSETW
jgi:hypothetical protein